MTIRNITKTDKNKLRKIRGTAGKCQDQARNTLVKGCLVQGAYIQFGIDLNTYNLFEALLYAESCEKDGFYKEGTVKEATQAALKAL